MGDALLSFLKSHPFWAVFIVIFAVLPIVGLILPIFRKFIGRRGLEQTPSAFEFHQEDHIESGLENTDKNATDESERPQKEA